jgi:uncharacterized protein
MVIGLLNFELHICGCESIKDKRRVVRSVKDRLHREHQVSVAEVGNLDRMGVATMALVLVNRDGRYAQSVLDSIEAKLKGLGDAELGYCHKQMLSADAIVDDNLADDGTPLWTAEELRSISADEACAQPEQSASGRG